MSELDTAVLAAPVRETTIVNNEPVGVLPSEATSSTPLPGAEHADKPTVSSESVFAKVGFNVAGDSAIGRLQEASQQGTPLRPLELQALQTKVDSYINTGKALTVDEMVLLANNGVTFKNLVRDSNHPLPPILDAMAVNESELPGNNQPVEQALAIIFPEAALAGSPILTDAIAALRDPAVASLSLQQIEAIKTHLVQYRQSYRLPPTLSTLFAKKGISLP